MGNKDVRLIDANAAKIRFAKHREDCINDDDINAANVFSDVVAELGEFPTFDAAPVVHGEWIGYETSSYNGNDEYEEPRWM